MRRLMLKLSQTGLANGIGVTFQQVQKYEKGMNRIGAGRLPNRSHSANPGRVLLWGRFTSTANGHGGSAARKPE
jgi:hypothetical protein